MQYGENPLESAERELFEETGIREIEIKEFKTYIYHHAVAHIYTAICDIDPTSIHLQEGETEDYFWYKEEDFKEIWKSVFVSEIQRGRIEPNLDLIIKQIKEMIE
jgi:8-oxo-dGTP pyrophosphatase MutT (NUDIX family)